MPEPKRLGQAGPQAHSWALAPGALREGLCPRSPAAACAMLGAWRALTSPVGPVQYAYTLAQALWGMIRSLCCTLYKHVGLRTLGGQCAYPTMKCPGWCLKSHACCGSHVHADVSTSPSESFVPLASHHVAPYCQ